MCTLAEWDIYIWCWKNKEYLSVEKDKQRNGVLTHVIKDKNNSFCLIISLGKYWVDERKESDKSDTQVFWDVVELLKDKALLKIVGGK